MVDLHCVRFNFFCGPSMLDCCIQAVSCFSADIQGYHVGRQGRRKELLLTMLEKRLYMLNKQI